MNIRNEIKPYFSRCGKRQTGFGNIAEPGSQNSGLPAIVRKIQKIASDNIVKMFAQTFRQRCQKVTARRRHRGQGISPASGVLTSKRYACALTASGG